MIQKIVHPLAVSLFAVLSVGSAESIRFEGVLGNSGYDGSNLVELVGTEFKENGRSSGLGLDRFGALWSFGGTDNIVRLSPDGRMLGSYPCEVKRNDSRNLVLVEDQVIVQSGKGLYSLPITAPSGTDPVRLEREVKRISLNAVEGRIGMVTSDLVVGIYDPVSDEFLELGQAEKSDRINVVDILEGEKVVVDGSWTYQEGRPREELAQPFKEPHQIVNGYVFGFGWHMTISRRNLDFEPDPGVVYGGSSGYFIGSLPEDGEMYMPRGMAHLGENRYAVVGPVGVIHLLSYDSEKQAFTQERRIGAIHFPGTVVLDEGGRVWFYSGYWNWSDGPSSILKGETSFNSRDWRSVQGVRSENGKVLFPFLFRGTPKLMHRAYDEVNKKTSSTVEDMPEDPTGMVLLPREGADNFLIVCNPEGQAIRMLFSEKWGYRKTQGAFLLDLGQDNPNVTSLARSPEGKVLAASNGEIVVLNDGGDLLTPVSRWNSWDGDRFGSKIYIAQDDGMLWVSDTENNRVLCFDVAEGDIKLIGEFSGDELEKGLNQPQRIDAAGSRAVVIDWGNQRLVQLSVQP
ncbi:MAG: hypothetical protein ACQKBT_06440 [Puniceicoccales bacterium]